MSLVVWLPLTGDLHNQGCSNATITNYSATIDINGKIGNCYSFDGTSTYLQIRNFNPSSWGQFSFTCWCYPTDDFNHLFLIRGSNQHRIRINSGGFSFRDTKNSTLRTISFNNNTIPINTWSHLACIYNHGEVYIYLNGTQIAHSTTYYNSSSQLYADLNEIRIARVTTTSTSSYYTGKLNDIRIYNHALSAAEVKEISQGLVLHYKLDDITNGIQDSSGYGHNGTINKTLTLSDNTARYSICGYFGAYNSPNIIVNDTSSFAPALSNCTVTWWGKYDTTKTLLFAGQTTSYYIAASNNNTYYHHNVGSNTKTFYKDGVAGSYKCAADGWHFFAITGLDLSAWTTLKLNGYSSAYPLKGYINDLRIYSTILSPDDILTLYHTGAKIDNLQNLHTFEYIENQSSIKLTKQGQFKCDEITENTTTKFKQNNIAETNNLIEF